MQREGWDRDTHTPCYPSAQHCSFLCPLPHKQAVFSSVSELGDSDSAKPNVTVLSAHPLSGALAGCAPGLSPQQAKCPLHEVLPQQPTCLSPGPLNSPTRAGITPKPCPGHRSFADLSRPSPWAQGPVLSEPPECGSADPPTCTVPPTSLPGSAPTADGPPPLAFVCPPSGHCLVFSQARLQVLVCSL